MRRFFAILGMVFGMQGFAQFADAPLEGVPTVPITRKLCVQMDDDAHTRSIQRTASSQADAPLSAFAMPFSAAKSSQRCCWQATFVR